MKHYRAEAPLNFDARHTDSPAPISNICELPDHPDKILRWAKMLRRWPVAQLPHVAQTAEIHLSYLEGLGLILPTPRHYFIGSPPRPIDRRPTIYTVTGHLDSKPFSYDHRPTFDQYAKIGLILGRYYMFAASEELFMSDLHGYRQYGAPSEAPADITLFDISPEMNEVRLPDGQYHNAYIDSVLQVACWAINASDETNTIYTGLTQQIAARNNNAEEMQDVLAYSADKLPWVS